MKEKIEERLRTLKIRKGLVNNNILEIENSMFKEKEALVSWRT